MAGGMYETFIPPMSCLPKWRVRGSRASLQPATRGSSRCSFILGEPSMVWPVCGADVFSGQMVSHHAPLDVCWEFQQQKDKLETQQTDFCWGQTSSCAETQGSVCLPSSCEVFVAQILTHTHLVWITWLLSPGRIICRSWRASVHQMGVASGLIATRPSPHSLKCIIGLSFWEHCSLTVLPKTHDAKLTPVTH